MELYEFRLLGSNEQAQRLWDDGVFLISRNRRNEKLLLYQLFNFYVEVVYDVDDNRLKEMKSFKTTRLLYPYLKEIKIVI